MQVSLGEKTLCLKITKVMVIKKKNVTNTNIDMVQFVSICFVCFMHSFALKSVYGHVLSYISQSNTLIVTH